MQTMTSAYANKMLKSLEEDKAFQLNKEEEACTYVAAINEEPVVPDYDYVEVATTIAALDEKIAIIKHELNVTNANAKVLVGDVTMSIDSILITDRPKDNVSNPQPASVAYSPQNVVSLATAKCQAGGMITTQQNLQNHLNDGSITQEEYNEYYPYDGMEGSYYSVFVETDLNKASTIDGQRLSSEDAIAEYIASMLLLETDSVFYISYDGVYTTGGTDYYEFRCHR